MIPHLHWGLVRRHAQTPRCPGRPACSSDGHHRPRCQLLPHPRLHMYTTPICREWTEHVQCHGDQQKKKIYVRLSTTYYCHPIQEVKTWLDNREHLFYPYYYYPFKRNDCQCSCYLLCPSPAMYLHQQLFSTHITYSRRQYKVSILLKKTRCPTSYQRFLRRLYDHNFYAPFSVKSINRRAETIYGLERNWRKEKLLIDEKSRNNRRTEAERTSRRA